MAGPTLLEKTRAQILQGLGKNSYKPLTGSYATYRRIAKHPTVAMARALALIPILSGRWAVECDDDASDEWVKLIQDEIVKKRTRIVEHAARARLDYGWCPFEKVWEVNPDGFLTLSKIKPLIQDISEILIGDHGELLGVKQKDVNLFLDCAMVISFDVRGTDWYGTALMENVVDPFNWWMKCNGGAERYDAKIAGSRIIGYYPIGISEDADGNPTDNFDLTVAAIKNLESAGSTCFPSTPKQGEYGENDKREFDLEINEAGAGQQGGFVERLEYLDKLFSRGLLCPERAVQDGQHGTKADAEAHGDVALEMCELADQTIVDAVNEQLVDQTMVLNHGPSTKGKVRITRVPLADDKRAILETLYTAFLASPNGFMAEADQIDWDAVKDHLGIPKAQEVTEPGAVRPGVDASDPRAKAVRTLYKDMASNG